MTDEPKTPQEPEAAGSACSARLGQALASDAPYFRALDAYAKKVTQRLKKLEYHAAALADALDGYQESCGEGHPRPNYECTCCGGEEATLTAYKEFITTNWAQRLPITGPSAGRTLQKPHRTRAWVRVDWPG